MTTFFRLLDVGIDHKPSVLLDCVRNHASGPEFRERVFEVDVPMLRSVTGSPFAYWLTSKLRGAFGKFGPFENNNRSAKHGGVTLDDNRFLRLWTEVCETSHGHGFVPFAKGGPARKYYADLPVSVRWQDNGAEIKAHVSAVRERNGWGDQWTAVLNGYSYYLTPGLTWPLRASHFSPQVLPEMCIFSARGYCIFAPREELLATLALCASSAFDYLFKVRLGRFAHPEFIVGVLEDLPTPTPADRDAAVLAEIAMQGWALQRRADGSNETSHAFILPAGILVKVARAQDAGSSIVELQKRIDEVVFALYGFGPEEVRHIMDFNGGTITEEPHTAAEDEEKEPSVDGGAEIHSWSIGVAFGRFDIRLATGERPIPPDPGPFDPLPARSPGMMPDDSAVRAILVDDAGHKDDLSAAAAAVLARVEMPEPNDLRAWLARDFFPLHIKMYSKSRRKAPIYWQLATPSASYSVWLYLHAFHKDTLYKVQNDYVAPKLEHEERRLAALREALPGTPTSADRKALEAQETLVDELRSFLDEVKRVAPLWNPDLDDGAILNFAPLHRLVPHHKPWQKEVKAAWDALSEGEYDWAHLAMHLWPERVVPKCATDRSLAIAHGLEDVFWVEDAGKWKPRTAPLRPADELVKERTSAAVKAALHSLQTAPAAQGSSKPSRRKGAR